MKEKLLTDVLSYVELADSLIDDLAKRPAFSDAALTKAAMAMSQAGLIHENEQATLADLFRREPDKALESLVKVAEAKKRPASIPSLGAPVESGKNRTGSERESDRVLYQRLGLSH